MSKLRALCATVCLLAIVLGVRVIYAEPVQLSSTELGNCPLFPADNPWNQDISSAPVDPNSDIYINNINANDANHFLRAGFGHYPEYGIPYIIVGSTQPKLPIT